MKEKPNWPARRLTRRSLIFEGAKVVLGLTIAGILGSCVEDEKDEITKTWLDLEKRFSYKPVDFETFKSVVVPLTARTYVAHSGTSLAEAEIINSIKFNQISRPNVLEGQILSLDVTDPRNAHRIRPPLFGLFDFKQGIIDLDFNTYPQPVKRKWGSHYEFVSHLTLLRSGLLHEFVHFDTKLKSPSAIKNLVDFPPEETLDTGFRVIWYDPKTTYLDDGRLGTFDEEITDLLACRISNKADLDYSTFRERGRNLKKLFSTINLDFAKLLNMHRQSDIVSFVNFLAEKSEGVFSQDKKLEFGLRIVEQILKNNWYGIEELFPGFQQQKDGIFICRP